MPGENLELVFDLVHDVAVDLGSRFTLREGGKTSKSLLKEPVKMPQFSFTVGTGVVTKIL